MAQDRPISIQDLRRRLAKEGTDAERLAALIGSRHRIVEQLPRDEAERYLREAAGLARKLRSSSDLATAGVALSELCRDAGDVEASIECAGLVEEAARESGNPIYEGQYSYLTGRAHEVKGNYEPAHDCYERCLKAWRRSGSPQHVRAALNQLGCLLWYRGRAAEALEYWQECLKLDGEIGDIPSLASHQYNIGTALAKLGRWEDAFECYYRAIGLAERHQLLPLRSYVLNSLGELFLERDKAAKAIDIFRMAVEAAERGEVPSEAQPDHMANLGLAYQRNGDLASAAHVYGRALALSEKHENRRGLAIVLWGMAELALDQGQLDRCQDLARRSVAVAREVGLRCEEAQALRVMALLHVTRHEDAQARDCFEQAVALLGDLEESLELARVRFHFGRHLLLQGERDAAMTHLKAASRAFRKLGVVAEGHEVQRLLLQQQMGVDIDMALLEGISGLSSLSVEPQALLEQAMGLLLEVLRFDSAAIVARGRAVLVMGNPDLTPALALGDSQELIVTDSVTSWPVCQGGSLLGRIYLERAMPIGVEHTHLVLETIAKLLAAPIQRLTELAVAVEERPGLAGLRYQGVIGPSQRMADVLATVCSAASKSAPVLIHGESGTGKELIARALHDSGARAGKPFVAVNCAGVPEGLLEVEFFGTEDGGAAGGRLYGGKFGAADRGTIFLAEIGDVSPALQARLLRVLEEKMFERVGGRAPINVDVRVVAATTRPIWDLVAQGKFREDLHSRLKLVELVLPSLRERTEDIPELVRHFMRRTSREFGRSVTGVSPEAMSRLTMHRWPGNVRELEHVVERMVLLASGDTIQLDDLPPNL